MLIDRTVSFHAAHDKARPMIVCNSNRWRARGVCAAALVRRAQMILEMDGGETVSAVRCVSAPGATSMLGARRPPLGTTSGSCRRWLCRQYLGCRSLASAQARAAQRPHCRRGACVGRSSKTDRIRCGADVVRSLSVDRDRLRLGANGLDERLQGVAAVGAAGGRRICNRTPVRRALRPTLSSLRSVSPCQGS